MNGNRIKYLLGIDGGGTKTEFLLTELNGNELNRIILGTSNPVNIGTEKSKEILRQGITRICEGLNFDEISVFAGISGSGSVDLKEEIREFLNTFGFGACANASDTESVLNAALKGENGVAVIMGTGIVAFSQADGKLHRVGGCGYMIDKGGSGFHLGADVLGCAFSCLDGRGGSSLMLELAESRLGSSLENSLSKIYSGGAAYVASFAPIAFEAYQKGDLYAEKIIDRNAREAAQLIEAARKFLNNKDEKTVICGGLCKQKDILRPFILKYIKDKHTLTFSDEPAINGAIALAKSNIQDGERNAKNRNEKL